MKNNLILRLMTVFALTAIFTSTTVNAFSFGNLFKKVSGFVKKAAPMIQKVVHGPIGQMALQAGEAAIAAKAGPEAGQLFAGAATSLHLADEAETQADNYDQQAQQAEDAGDYETAKQHRATAQMHRETARNHRENHQRQRDEYESVHKRNFDDDYAEHVAPHITHHAREMYPEHFNDDDDDNQDDDDGGDDDDDDY
jgi:hypothetical protein